IVEAGARRDLGQDEEARRILERAVTTVRPGVAELAVARLRYAYADALLDGGQEAEARHWFSAAAELDREQQTDAQQRRDELDGLLINYDEGDGEEFSEPQQGSQR
ncbi:MAG TPA: hypothetical protein VFT17_09365, partial [Propionibacteriaceae bacterium]|nr:hypothetical protein [Propionibacteriaceae bacterium]